MPGRDGANAVQDWGDHELTLGLDSEKAAVYDISMSKTIEPIIKKLRECKELLRVDWIDDEEDDEEDDVDDDSEEDAYSSDSEHESGRGRRDYSPQKDGEPPWEVFDSPESLGQPEGERIVRLLDYACGTGLATRVSHAHWNPLFPS